MTAQLLLAYYRGAYGPTVRIDARSLGQLVAIRRLFGRLASGDILEENFCGALNCRLDSMHSLLVRRAVRRPFKELVVDYRGRDGPAFTWSNTNGGWLECAEKVDALVDCESPGHQYLTREGIDDALVELAFREGGEQGYADYR